MAVFTAHNISLINLYFVNPLCVHLVYCLTPLILMLVLNLAFGWSNLTPIETPYINIKNLREFNFNLPLFSSALLMLFLRHA